MWGHEIVIWPTKDIWVTIWRLVVYWLVTASVINYHKLRGLKQHKSIVLHCCKPEAWQQDKIKMLGGIHSFSLSLNWMYYLPFLAPSQCLNTLRAFLLHLQSQTLSHGITVTPFLSSHLLSTLQLLQPLPCTFKYHWDYVRRTWIIQNNLCIPGLADQQA